MTSITQGFFDFVAWLPTQADRTDVVKGVNNLICDVVEIADKLSEVIDKVNLVVPERLREAARFAKTYNWCRDSINLLDRVKQWNTTRNFFTKPWHEKVAMISLTVADALGTAQSLQDIDLLDLGSFANPLKTVRNIFYIPVSASAAWNSFNKWNRAPGELRGLNSNWQEVNEVLAEGKDAVKRRLELSSLSSEEVRFWAYVSTYYDTLDTRSSELSFVKQGDGTFQVSAEPLAKRNCRITRVKEALGFIENIGKVALGAMALVAIYFGLNAIALFSFSMIVAKTVVHLVGVSKKLFEGANKVEDAADYQFPPNLQKAFGVA